MKKLSKPLIELLPTVNYWRRSWGGNYCAFVYNEDGGYNDEYEVTPADLNECHPLLFTFMEASINRYKGDKDPNFADGSDVWSTLALHQGRYIRINNSTGQERLLAAMYDFPEENIRAPGQSEYMLFGHRFTIETVTYQGQKLQIAVDSDNVAMPVLEKDLNVRYPGCLEKVVVGQTLELSIEEIMQYAFYNNTKQQATADLSAITFTEQTS